METVACPCGRTVPATSAHRPGKAHPSVVGKKRTERKAEWCPETDLRKKAEEEAKVAREKADREAAEAAQKPPAAPEASQAVPAPEGA